MDKSYREYSAHPSGRGVPCIIMHGCSQPPLAPPPMRPGPDAPESLPTTPPAASPENTTDSEGVKTPGFGIGILIGGLVIAACAVRRW
ncbi:hypothetical protein [Methanogenium cariaci]|uniref:hypothetical protein n=1 Tax=Methanogenium cariaci TaxID=2197 RepID=UPI0007820E78|nr:hypothetical protein [Methanogenium cariaci]